MTQSLLAFNELPTGSQIGISTSDRGVISGTAVPGGSSASSSPLAPQPSSLQGGLIVDPGNVTGVASAAGNGTATFDTVTGRVFDSWRNLVAAWGTWAPCLNVDTSIAFTGPNAATDPIYFYPVSTTGVKVILRTPLVPVATGVVLSGVVAKSRVAGANSLLQANLGATGIVQGRAVVNTTRGNSIAHVETNVAGNVWNLTQPMTPTTPGGQSRPSEVDTWANGDVVDVSSYTTLTFVAAVASLAGVSGVGAAPTFSLYRINLAATSAGSTLQLGACNVEECTSSHGFALQMGQGRANIWNHYFLTGSGIFDSAGQRVEILAGGIAATSSIFLFARNSNIDADFVTRSNINCISGTTSIGFCFIGTGGVNAITVTGGGSVSFATLFYGGHCIYGSAGSSISLLGTSYGQMNGTYAAGFTAPALITPGILLNGTSTASSQDNANPATTIAGNIGTTVAALDAAQGAAGFGGVAFKLGGATIANRA